MACGKGWNSKLHVLLLGAFSSGKTTILREINDDLNFQKRPVIPTLGMYLKNVSYQNYKLQICDIGGSKELQNEWPNLFGEAQGFMFTIDSTDMKNVLANTKRLEKTLEHPDVEGKPFLIIVTKCKSPYTMQENLLFTAYDMDTILSIHKNVQICFCDSEHHPPAAAWSSKSTIQLGGAAWSSKSTIRLDRKSTIRLGGDRDESITRQNLCYNQVPDTGGADTEPPEDVTGASLLDLGGDEKPLSDDDTVDLMILTFMEGMQWLLEFIKNNKPDLDSRLASSRKKEVGVTKAQKIKSRKQLIKVQKAWEKHYKNISKSALAISIAKTVQQSNITLGSQHDSHNTLIVIQSASNQHILERLTKIHESEVQFKS